MKTLHALIAAAFIAGSSAVLAAEPELVTLNDAELDGLTAGTANVLLVLGGTAQAAATSIAPGLTVSATQTGAGATATVVETGPLTHTATGGSAAASTSVSANF